MTIFPNSKILVGSAAASRIYLGATLVWSAQAAGFDLASIPGLAFWVEADDSPATVDGPITYCPTRVGPELHGNAHIVMNGPNGRKALSFHSDRGREQLDSYPLTLGPDFTMLSVVYDAGSQSLPHADLMDFNHGQGGWVVQRDGTGPGHFLAWRSGGYTVSPPDPLPSEPAIVQSMKDGTVGSYRVGEGTNRTVSGPAHMDLITTMLRLGNYVAGEPRTLNGKICAVAIWPRALNAEELALARAYFAARFLPAPVVVTPPAIAANVGPSVQGDWIGNYGADGYVLASFNPDATDVVNLPAGITYTEGFQNYFWAPNESSSRVLRSPDGSSRSASCWYTPGAGAVFTFANGYKGNFWVYVLDYDPAGRSTNFTVNGVSISMPSYHNGAWLGWPLDIPPGGTATLEMEHLGGVNSVISGVFLGGPLKLPTS